MITRRKKEVGCSQKVYPGRLMRFFLRGFAGTAVAIRLQAAQPDLAVSMKATPTTVSVGQLLTYTLAITNSGASPATSAQCVVTTISNATFFSASFSQGNFTQQPGLVTWSLGNLGPHASATGAVVVFPGATGSLSASVNVIEAEVDANPADNSTNVITTVASATFEPGANMLLARRSHTVTLLPNGKVLIAGGITATGTTSMVELYDPTTGNFTAAGDLTMPRANHTATLLGDGRVFLAGTTNAEIYNPATGLSVKTTNMITPRTFGHTATLLSNGRVLLAGGYIYFYSSPATEIFDPVSGTFTNGPTLRWSRYQHTATRLANNSVLIAGGTDGTYAEYLECDIVSPDGLSKVTTAPMWKSLQAGANLLPGGNVLISGGWYTLYDGVVFSPASNAFTVVSNAFERRFRHISQLLTNGTVLLCAGATSGQTAEIFSPTTGTFTRTTNLRESRDYAAGVTLPDGRVLVTGGITSTETGTVYHASTEIYNPSTAKALPLILTHDASAAEDSGGVQFQLQLAAPMGVPVSVDYSTTDGSAAAGADYTAATGTVVFPPGVTNASLTVPILGDLDYEPTETFSLILANPTNAFLGLHQVTGSITNDDPKPTVSAQPGSIAEGNAYTNFLTFSVVLGTKSFEPVTVDYFTSDGTATAASNYFATNGTLNFDPGVTTQRVTVVTRSDIQAGPDRIFYLNLTNATNATIGATHVAGTILNDDGIAGVVHHFDFFPIASPQHNRVPFPLAITARDAFGQTVTNFSGGVTLWGTVTNTPWQEYGFEEGDFSQWTPLNLGNTPGPYEIDIFDVIGHGIASRAFRLAANAGAADGITRSINLQGSVTYYISVDLAAFNANGGFQNGDASTAHLLINGSEIWNFNFNVFGFIYPLQTFRTNLMAAYTPPATGAYALSLRFDRGFGQSEVWSYVDNVRISAANIAPTWAATFTNGVWSGDFQVNSTMQKVALLAEDVPGHFGTSGVFDVAASADLKITSSNSPAFVRAGSDEVISLTVSNLGPDAAGNVMLTNRLSGDLTIRSASSSQGTTLVSGALSVFNLGTIAAGQKAAVTVTVNPHSLGLFTNTANVVSDVFDGDLTKNLVQTTFLANPALVHANPLSVNEGNSGTNNASVALWLEGTVGQTITVGYATTNGTATSGVDYLAVAGNAVFPPNTLTQFVSIPMVGDVVKEPNETVLLNLSALSTNATLATTQAVLTIVDDDPVPSVTIADISILEGNSGTANAAFQVTLSNPSASIVNVLASTSDGTALASNDYVATTAMVTFAAGSTNQMFNVPVVGDANNESNQTFSVTLTNPFNCTISRAVATGTIMNDDAAPGRLHHFAWDAIPTPRYKDWPWAVTLRALDHLNNPATNEFVNTLVVARTENGYVQRLQDDFEDQDAVGWTNYNVAFSAIVTNETAASGNYSLRLSGATGVATAGLRRSISNSRPNKVSFAVRASRTNQIATRFTTYANSLARSAVFYFNNNGQMGMLDRTLGFRGVPYQSNRWYQVALSYDWASQKVDCSIDGAPVLTNIIFPDSVVSMDAVVLANQDNTVSWWDDIKVANDNLTNTFSITPSNFVSFVNGVKSNLVTISGAATNVYLTADDGFEHVGRSAYFTLLPVTLSLVTTSSITEGTPPVPAQVRIPVAFPQSVTLALTSTIPARLTVPASVIIPANETNATFNLTVIDDGLLNGTQLPSVIATGTNLVSATNVVAVQDNEPAVLTLTLLASASGGGIDLQVSGVPGISYRIESSSDLMNWAIVTNLVSTTAPFTFHIPAQGIQSSQKFYRAASN